MPPMVLAESLIRRISAVPLGYLLLWAGLAALSATLIVLMRSRWGRSRLLHKCAVLSLLVHVLLAGLAMAIKVVVGDGGAGAGPPIRVRLVDDVPPAADVAMAEPPPLLEAPPLQQQLEAVAGASTPSETAGVEDELARSEDAPARLEDKPVHLDESDTHRAEDTASRVEDLTAVADQPALTTESLPPIRELPATSVEAPAVPPAALGSTGGAPTSPYAQRMSPDRLRLVEQQGGSLETEEAVAAALEWLSAAQSADGRWDADRLGAGREHVVLGQDRNGAGAQADTGISGLALLAFLGAGHTHRKGKYQHTVGHGLDYLVRSQAADGSLFGDADLYAQMYCHSMATFALAEGMAMTGDERLKPAVRRAIDFSVKAQHPATGGWRYRVGDTGDTSQLGWQMMALASAQRAGIEVPSRTWTGVERFLRSVRRGTAGGLAAYRPDGPPTTSMTAEALYCRVLLAEVIGGSVDDSAASEATQRLLRAPPDRQQANMYYWYYATLALHHRQQVGDEAAAAWQTWNSTLADVLVDTQVTDGPDAGSWDPDTMWGGHGGRGYSTALAAMCLEVYYRYAPPPAHDQWIATRPDEANVAQ